MSAPSPKLFTPIQLGDITLQHRVVLAPLTRRRASATHVPHSSIQKEYYLQRACEPGTLLITSATFIAGKGGGFPNVEGIWSEEQIEAWKEVVDAVHAAGSFMYLQIWALGRAAIPDILAAEDPSYSYVSASDVLLTGKPQPPRPLTVDEIEEYCQLFATAASNAVHKAGFDGVELHAAHGYLVDQFLQTMSNRRMDEYGGSEENRCRFPLEALDAIIQAVGPRKTGIRISPWSKFQDMAMDDPVPTFTYLVQQIKSRFPDLAYLHLVEPRVSGAFSREPEDIGAHESNDFIREIWAPRPIISAGAYSREEALRTAEEKGDIIAYGRYFISNPDIVRRLREDIPFTPYNRATFYLLGSTGPEGYTDYPFAEMLQN